MPRKKTRRQPHGSAWHWTQTDCWYYTPSGSKGRQPLFDEHGQRIRGLDNRQAAQLALAWLLAMGNDVAPIPGTKRRKWLEENLRSADVQVSAADVAALDAAFRPGVAAGERYADMSNIDR